MVQATRFVRPPNVLRSAAFRLAAVYALIFCISVAALTFVAYERVRSSMSRQLQSAAQSDAEIFARALARRRTAGAGAPSPQEQALQSRLIVRGAREPAAASATDRSNEPLGPFTTAGNGFRDEEGSESGWIGFGLRLADGRYVAALRSNEPIGDAMEALVEAATIAALIALVLSMAGGYVLSAFYLKRVDEVERTARAIIDGDLARRMPQRGTGDEFDRLATSLNRMLDRNSELLEGLRQVSTGVAHDLRTPLTRLRHRLERLLDQDLGQQQQQRELGGALSEVDHILAIFTALLQISQVEAGAIRAGFRLVDLTGVLKQLAEIYQPVLEAGDRRLITVLDPGLNIQGDRELLTQLFVNLLENAVTHTPAGTTVVLSGRDRGGTVEVSVSDDGPGIAPRERDLVFRRFFRSDLSRATPGTGLGLSLAAAIAELHSSTIRLDDNTPGAKFIVSFPSARR